MKTITVYGLLAIAIALMLGTNTILAFESPVRPFLTPVPNFTPPYDLPWCSDVPVGTPCYGVLPTPTPAPTFTPPISPVDTPEPTPTDTPEPTPTPTSEPAPRLFCVGLPSGQSICTVGRWPW